MVLRGGEQGGGEFAGSERTRDPGRRGLGLGKGCGWAGKAGGRCKGFFPFLRVPRGAPGRPGWCRRVAMLRRAWEVEGRARQGAIYNQAAGLVQREEARGRARRSPLLPRTPGLEVAQMSVPVAAGNARRPHSAQSAPRVHARGSRLTWGLAAGGGAQMRLFRTVSSGLGGGRNAGSRNGIAT